MSQHAGCTDAAQHRSASSAAACTAARTSAHPYTPGCRASSSSSHLRTVPRLSRTWASRRARTACQTDASIQARSSQPPRASTQKGPRVNSASDHMATQHCAPEGPSLSSLIASFQRSTHLQQNCRSGPSRCATITSSWKRPLDGHQSASYEAGGHCTVLNQFCQDALVWAVYPITRLYMLMVGTAAVPACW